MSFFNFSSPRYSLKQVAFKSDPSLNAIRPFSAKGSHSLYGLNKYRNRSDQGKLKDFVVSVGIVCAPSSPSCSLILIRSLPPTIPTLIFYNTAGAGARDEKVSAKRRVLC